jgi:hypothetical protein
MCGWSTTNWVHASTNLRRGSVTPSLASIHRGPSRSKSKSRACGGSSTQAQLGEVNLTWNFRRLKIWIVVLAIACSILCRYEKGGE